MENATVALVGFNPIKVGTSHKDVLAQQEWLKPQLSDKIKAAINKVGAKTFIVASHSLTSKWMVEVVLDIQKDVPEIALKVLFPFAKLGTQDQPKTHMEAHLKQIGELTGNNGIIDIPDCSGDFEDADRLQYAADNADFAIIINGEGEDSQASRFIGLVSEKGLRHLTINPEQKQSAWV